MADRKRLLNDLRVIDLRAELEKRNLDKSGVRGVLILRLTEHLKKDGHDPETYKFDLAGPEAKTPAKRPRRSESTIEQEADETPAMEDMIVQDDAGEEEETEQTPEQNNGQVETSQEKTSPLIDNVSRKRENTMEDEASPPKKACLDDKADIKNEDDNKTIENNDAEDSINLDLGEDELLNEETDNTSKSKKDVAQAERPALAPADVKYDADEVPAAAAAAAAAGDTSSLDADADSQQQVDEAPATSNDTDDKKNDDQNEDKEKDDSGDKKDKKDESKEGGARNLWVSGLSGDTRAKDLKQLCSKHGKVIGAKVVTNARTPGSRCYGYVTMASAQDAENCIKNLHRTELHGRMISVEKAKSESESSSRRQATRHTERRSSKDHKNETDKEHEDGKENSDKTGDKIKKEGDASGPESTRSASHTRDKTDNKDAKGRRSTRSRERRRSPREVLSFSKIWKERDMARARERSRAQREEERRRRAAEEALRERERRQRQEKHRLALEREKLRAEREKIEREKNELLRLERERHRLEREKLELERLELKRAQLRLEEERRKRGYESSSGYRKAPSPPPEPSYERDPRHKRAPPPPMSSSRQFEAPPPPRFEMPAPAYEREKRDRDRDYKRDYPRHASSGNIKYPANGSSNDDSRQPIPPGTRPKEPSRAYEARDTRSYRPSPPTKPEQRTWTASNRYPDNAPPSKARVANSGVSESWSSGGAGGGGAASGEARYGGGGGGGGGGYDSRYPPSYQPPPPGATYPDRYAPQRDYRKY